MSFLDLAKERFSVRKYEDRPVEDEKLAKILEAGNIAPTGANNQPQRIHVIRSEEVLGKIRGLTKCHCGAPVVLLGAYQESEEWKNPLDAVFTKKPCYLLKAAAGVSPGTPWAYSP